jgi:protein disulfide-isomerase
MKTLFTSAVGAFAALALASTAMAKPGWSEDFAKASEQAKAEKKMLLIDFTGSDWCAACTEFNKDVLLKPEFAEYAKKNLVLFEADFPLDAKQSEELKAQNEKLRVEYGVKGFPAFVVLDANGKKVGEFLGYRPGGPAAFIADLEKLKK